MPNTGMLQQLLALKLDHQKMMPEQDRFSEVSELSPGLFFFYRKCNCVFQIALF